MGFVDDTSAMAYNAAHDVAHVTCSQTSTECMSWVGSCTRVQCRLRMRLQWRSPAMCHAQVEKLPAEVKQGVSKADAEEFEKKLVACALLCLVHARSNFVMTLPIAAHASFAHACGITQPRSRKLPGCRSRCSTCSGSCRQDCLIVPQHCEGAPAAHNPKPGPASFEAALA
jgi:hypothetical protein